MSNSLGSKGPNMLVFEPGCCEASQMWHPLWYATCPCVAPIPHCAFPCSSDGHISWILPFLVFQLQCFSCPFKTHRLERETVLFSLSWISTDQARLSKLSELLFRLEVMFMCILPLEIRNPFYPHHMNAQSLMPITLNQHKGALFGFRISMALIEC